MSIGWMAESLARCIQIGGDGAFVSRLHALELTVPHKTVAEPH
jgi:hypothetical protein